MATSQAYPANVPVATFQGYPVSQPGQPVFVQPGTAVPMAVQMPANAGAVLLPVVADPPNYEYIPHDFIVLSLLTAILCGIFSPLSLVLTIPAVILSHKSRRSAKEGKINNARSLGICAAYLNVAAIFLALFVACLATGLTVGIFYRRNGDFS